MIIGITGNNIIKNPNYIQTKNKNKSHVIPFGKLEKDDTFESRTDQLGFFGKIKQKAIKFFGGIREKIANFIMSKRQKGYKDEKTIHYLDEIGKKFHTTPEGICRMQMSDEEIEQKIQSAYDKAFDKLEVPKALRPNLLIESEKNILGGYYKRNVHRLFINAKMYRNGIELNSLIMHEATHCKEALLRNGIPQNKVDEIIKSQIISHIKDSNQSIMLLNDANLSFFIPPKLSDKMQEDFIQFAEENLFNKSNSVSFGLIHYNNSIESIEDEKEKQNSDKIKALKNALKLLYKDLTPIFTGIETLIQNHPELKEQFGSEEAAFNVLMDYSLAINTEYNKFTDTKIGGTFGTQEIKVKELNDDELKQAEKSLINYRQTVISNLLFSKELTMITKLAYDFSPEEVLAETNGRKFLIKNYSEELEKSKKEGTLTPDRETYLNLQIELAKKIIEYRLSGDEFLNKQRMFAENLENEELKQSFNAIYLKVTNMLYEIRDLEQKITNYDKQ